MGNKIGQKKGGGVRGKKKTGIEKKPMENQDEGGELCQAVMSGKGRDYQGKNRGGRKYILANK